MNHKQTLLPHPNEGKRMCDPDFTYVPSTKTNIVESFRKMGWTPPSELKSLQEESKRT